MAETVEDVTVATSVFPKVGDKLFWRVYQGGLHIDHLELRRKVGPFSVKVDSIVLFFRDDDGNILTPEASILQGVRAILHEQRELVVSEQWKKFYGDHAGI